MIMGANQPYFMPYIGYWQLINAVDVFIILDDYNYIEGGWIGRNRILDRERAQYYRIEISHADSREKINELYLCSTINRKKKLRQLKIVYGKAPFFCEGYELMERIINCEEQNLALFLENSMRAVCEYLEINTNFIRSSDIEGNSKLKREYRIYDQCNFVGADTYINAIGGQALYQYNEFAERGIKLGFIKTNTEDIRYQQFGCDFVPNLSIIDVIMFNSKAEIKKMLEMHTILWGRYNDARRD